MTPTEERYLICYCAYVMRILERTFSFSTLACEQALGVEAGWELARRLSRLQSSSLLRMTDV